MAITTLIDGLDNSERVRDQIAGILASESAAQQALAVAANRDPSLWALRVYTERANPWADWIDPPEAEVLPELAVPIVNVSFDNSAADGRAGGVVHQQKVSATYNIDCYGHAVSDARGVGHIPGDMGASFAAQRAARLVRQILMAGTYTYLGMRGTVWKRWVQSITQFQPAIDNRVVEKVVGVRIAFVVDFSESAPQVEGQVMESLSLTLKRAENGEVIATMISTHAYPQP